MKHGTMTVKELKAALNDLPDAMPIVIAGGDDHSYYTGGDPGNVKAFIVPDENR